MWCEYSKSMWNARFCLRNFYASNLRWCVACQSNAIFYAVFQYFKIKYFFSWNCLCLFVSCSASLQHVVFLWAAEWKITVWLYRNMSIIIIIIHHHYHCYCTFVSILNCWTQVDSRKLVKLRNRVLLSGNIIHWNKQDNVIIYNSSTWIAFLHKNKCCCSWRVPFEYMYSNCSHKCHSVTTPISCWSQLRCRVSAVRQLN